MHAFKVDERERDEQLSLFALALTHAHSHTHIHTHTHTHLPMFSYLFPNGHDVNPDIRRQIRVPPEQHIRVCLCVCVCVRLPVCLSIEHMCVYESGRE